MDVFATALLLVSLGLGDAAPSPGSPAAEPVAEAPVATAPRPESFVLRGRLVDSQGRVPPDPSCRYIQSTNQGTANLGSCRFASDGSFLIVLAPGNGCRIDFRSARTVTVRLSQAGGAAGEERDLGTIALPTGATVAGRVVDESGQPLSGARVWAIRPGDTPVTSAYLMGDVAETRTGAQGDFELAGLPAGPNEVRVTFEGYAPGKFPVPIEPEEERIELGQVELFAGGELEVRTPLPPGENAAALLELDAGRPQTDWLKADFEGEVARFTEVPRGEHRLWVTGSRFFCPQPVEIKERAISLRCDRERPAVKGQATRGDGSLAATGTLELRSSSGPNFILVSPGAAAGPRSPQLRPGTWQRIEIELSPKGQFTTRELSPGDWKLIWRKPEGGVSRQLDVHIGEGPEVELQLDFGGFQVLGRVVDSAGNAVAGARVWTRETHAGTVTGADGSFRLEVDQPGAIEIKAEEGRRSSETLKVVPTPEGTPAELQLGDPAEPVEPWKEGDPGEPPIWV